MSTYVRFRCGAMTLYLDARGVRAVTEVSGDNRKDLAEWEGLAVEQLDLNELLGQPGPGHQALVVAAGEDIQGRLVMLTVDSVENVLSLQPAEFRALPPMSGGFGNLFDAAVELHRGQQLGLRLRYPLPAELSSRGA